MSDGRNKNSKTKVRKKQRNKAARIKSALKIARKNIRNKKRKKAAWLQG